MNTVTTCFDMLNDSCVSERPRYFPRQLITPTDMTLESEYFRNKIRRHNRLLHGWGVVCGALVCPKPASGGNGYEAWKVIVKPGYILGPYGDEIMIDTERTFDLRTMCLTGVSGDPCSEPASDPWCSEILVKRDPGSIYVAVQFKEVMSRPVRVQPAGCGCDETQCEYSRLCDGYEICSLTECPQSNQSPPKFDTLTMGPLSSCPPCPSDPWVVLAKVDVDENGVIMRIDNCSCRRMVLSFSNFWWSCANSIESLTVQPNELSVNQEDVTLDISGTNFKEGLIANLGHGVTVNSISVKSDKELTLQLSIDSDAVIGPRTITVINPNCATATAAINLIAESEKKSTTKKTTSKKKS